MSSKAITRAKARALTNAALITGAFGIVALGLGGAYIGGALAGEVTRGSLDVREAAANRFSDQALERQTAAMGPGAVAVAQRHDPMIVGGAAQRDRQSALLAARLEQLREDDGKARLLRANFGGPLLGETPQTKTEQRVAAAGPFRLEGGLDSSRELDCLTQAVYYEARGETPSGQAAVAQVVLNRVRHPAFPKTVCGVVFQGAQSRGCQFSFACDGSMRRGREAGAWKRARKVAERALSGTVMAEVGMATHFHTTAVSPAWGPRMQRVTQVGMHVFYRNGRSAPIRGFTGQATPRAAEAEEPGYEILGPSGDAIPAEPAASLVLASSTAKARPDEHPPLAAPSPKPLKSAKAAPAAAAADADAEKTVS